MNELHTRMCTDEDFGIHEVGGVKRVSHEIKGELTAEENDATAEPFFFPANKHQDQYFIVYSPKMHCFEKERVRLYGVYEGVKAQTLSLVLERCDPAVRDTCKSEEEFQQWIKTKFVITIENTWVFRQDSYDEEKLTAESIFHFFPLSSKMKVEAGR